MITFTSGTERNRGLDGLRALAVGAVVAFHAGRPWALGGYLGVDAFFVLSGFLITGLLLNERSHTGRIRLKDFWARRMARLIPALVVMITVVMAVAAVTHADALRTLRGDALAALTYVGNWRFVVGHRGYFGQTAPSSLFEHTWSLAIEEQFYVVWPIVVVLVARSRRPRLAVGVVAAVGAMASAVAAAVLAHGGAGNARLYFGTDTRLQAILIGAALAACIAGRAPTHRQVGERRIRNGALHALACGGLIVTALLWWRLDGASPSLFRGGLTVAALSTAAIIPSLALVPHGFVGRILGVAPLRALGVISYGVYLWHWPVQLLLTRAVTGWQGAPLLVLRAGVTVAIATASYTLLEQPMRRRPLPAVGRLVSFGAMAAAGTAGAVLLATVALPAAPPTLSAGPSAYAVATSTTAPVPTTVAIAPSTTMRIAVAVPARPRPKPAPVAVTRFVPPTPVYRTEVLGDSVAQSVADGLAPIASRYGLTILDDGILGCGVAPMGNFRIRGVEYEDSCGDWQAVWTARVQAAGANVAVIQIGRHEVLDMKVNDTWASILDAPYADGVANGLDRAITIAASTGVPVVLLTAPYYWTGEAPDGRPWPENDVQRVNRFNQLLREAAARHPRTTVADLGRHTNPAGRYASTVSGVPMRKDGVHFTAAACAWFAPWLAPQIRAAAGG